MASWRIVDGPRGYEPRSSRSDVGWTWEIAWREKQRTVEVELTVLAASIAQTRPLGNVDAERARRSCGRTAIEDHLDDDDPPEVLVISNEGVSVG